MSAFCEPETTTSSPHASVSHGTAPRLETASTTTSAPASFAAAARAWTSATTPVEVSDWTSQTAFAGRSAQPRAQVVGARRLAPRVAEDVDVGAVRRRHRDPALAEAPGGDDEVRLARRDEVRDRRLERAGAGGAEEEHVVLGPADLAQAREDALVDGEEVGAAVMERRARRQRRAPPAARASARA